MYFCIHPALKNIISRNLGTFYRMFQKNIKRYKSDLISPQAYSEFENVLPKLINKVSTVNLINSNVGDRLKKIAECSAYENDLFRGSLAILVYETMEIPKNITEKSLQQIRTLAWGAEMIHSYFMMLDDLDKTQGMTYWCNYDPSLLRSFIYELLRMEFMGKPSYIDIVHLFDKTYNSIADLRTAFHTFQLPILLAMKLMKNVDETAYQLLQNTCLKLGRLYHMQTDFLDCYGEELDEYGVPKHSCDIQQGRCSWLAVSALQRCTPAQRIVLTACYGSKEPAHVERVKLLYDQLQIPKIYKEEEEKLCHNIAKNCNESNVLDKKLIFKILNVIKDRGDVQCLIKSKL